MRFGMYLPTEGDFADVRLLARLAREAEDAGWDGLFIWDELLPIYEHSDEVREALGETGDVVDSFVALTAIAAHTERLRFGALVTPLPRLRPEVFARQTATLDRSSDGRLILGVGLGNPSTQFTAFGGEGEARVRAAMVDEFLDVLVQLWSGNEVKARGPHYVAEGVSMTPTPRQRPRIPIWIGADSKNRAPRRRAARWDGFVPASDSWSASTRPAAASPPAPPWLLPPPGDEVGHNRPVKRRAAGRDCRTTIWTPTLCPRGRRRRAGGAAPGRR